MPKFKQTEEILKIMKDKENIRNAGIIAHVDHGKTTLSDSLLAEAGMLSPSVAGEARALDYLEEEQKRGITIKAANISLLHEEEGKEYVINLIDTPGHVDFTGNVTRALRAIDGANVVVDAVEEVMVQTETVTRQALGERVRPVLFINKIDRLIRELKLDAPAVQEKLNRIIRDFNGLINTYGEPEFKDKWKVNPAEGTVSFGSALHGWGFTLAQMQEQGLKFSDIVAYYNEDRYEELKKILPVHGAILDMIINHLPNPLEAQPYRIPKIWLGDPESEIGKAMKACDENAPTVICLNKVVVDPHAGIVSTGRVFSGTISEGDNVYCVTGKKGYRVQQMSIYMGARREIVDAIPAGNIAALLGLDVARAGETVCSESVKAEVVPFEKIKYVSEPVITIAVEPKHPKDLPKLIDLMQKLSIQDPNLVTTINQETGEYLLSGMGELHLEISVKEIQNAVDVTTSQPIVVYRETITGVGGPVLGKSPNKHSRVWIVVEPLNEETIKLMVDGEISEYQDASSRTKLLREKGGWDAKDARNVWALDEHVNIVVDQTKGVQYMREVKDTMIAGVRWATESGPLAEEPIRGIRINVTDCTLHEDPIHRGPAQVMPMTRRAIWGAFLSAEPTLLEPIYKIQANIPPDYIGTVSGILSQRRGHVIDVQQKGTLAYITGEIPVRETFGLASDMRAKTSGRAFWQTQFTKWEALPKSLSKEVIAEIRKRKGLKPEPPVASEYIDTI
ncbi:MAG: elongation factor EF-2 [Candidatus Freyarchaeum deiterrae]